LVRIAVDAMGGDHAPENIIEGAVKALRDMPGEREILFVGDSGAIKTELSKYDTSGLPIRIVHTTQVVEMDEPPAAAIMKKPDSSIVRAMGLLRTGDADGFFSAGSTGAVTAGAWLKLKPLEGIERPALATTLPNLVGTGVLLDAGANSDCRPRHLVQFAVMGNVFARDVLGIENPRVGLMNIGEESTKGNDLTREVFTLLETKNLNFIGNVEGRNVFDGTVDVIICDGFVGNVIIKPAFRRLRKKVDYAEYGGAPLLGVNGVCVVGHGRSSPGAVANAIAVAAKFIRRNVNEHLVRAIHDADYSPSQAQQKLDRPGIRRRVADRLSALRRSARARQRPGKAFGGH